MAPPYTAYQSETRLADLVDAALARYQDEEDDELIEDIQYEPGQGPPSAKTRFCRTRVLAPPTHMRASTRQPAERQRNCSAFPQSQTQLEDLRPLDSPPAPLPGQTFKRTRRKQSAAHAKQRRGVRAGHDGLNDAAIAATIGSATTVASDASVLALYPANGYVNAAKRKATAPVPTSGRSAKKQRKSSTLSEPPPPPLTGQPKALRSQEARLGTLPDPGRSAVQALKDSGYQILAGDPHSAGVVLDADGVISAVRARRPQGENWDQVTLELDAALHRLHNALGEDQAKLGKGVNRWDGVFKHIFWGLSFGGGQREPGYLAVKNKYHAALKEFTETPAVRAFAKHIRNTMEVWQPEVLKDCDALAAALSEWDPDMLPAYPGLPLFAESANTGDQAVAPDHYDMFNAIDKFCFVIPTGTYDPTQHGLIVLHELKIAIQAAPGDVVFFPSALIRHGNTPIAPTAIRRSWTLFTAGSLYRWWDAGFRTLRSMSAVERKEFGELVKARLRERMARHMTLEQLKVYRSEIM